MKIKSVFKQLLFFSTLCVVMLLIYRLLWFKTMLEPYRPEWFVLGFGLMLLLVGVLLARQWQKFFAQPPSKEITKHELEEFSMRNSLSPAEIEVVKLLMDGKNNAEIAESRHVSLNTVKTHLSNIYSKTGTKHRTQLLSSITFKKQQNHPKV